MPTYLRIQQPKSRPNLRHKLRVKVDTVNWEPARGKFSHQFQTKDYKEEWDLFNSALSKLYFITRKVQCSHYWPLQMVAKGPDPILLLENDL